MELKPNTEYKFKVANKEQSVLVYEYLLKIGYSGIHPESLCQGLHLFTNHHGDIHYGDIETYNESYKQAINFEFDTKIVITGINAETITLNNKQYLKSDLEEALKHLTPVGE